MPTMSANVIASSVYNSSDGLARPLNILETKRDVNATGPTASCLEEPKIAYTNTGKQPESVKKNDRQIKNDNRTGIHTNTIINKLIRQ